MDHLESVHIASDRNLIDLRFPVQLVIRPISSEHHDFRGYAGVVASGVLEVGDEVIVLPSGFSSRVASIDGPDGPLQEAFPPQSVVVRLEDDLDISRGDMLCRRNNRPNVGQDISAMVCWMAAEPLREGTDVRDQAHDALGASAGAARSSTAWTSTACTATRTPASSS